MTHPSRPQRMAVLQARRLRCARRQSPRALFVQMARDRAGAWRPGLARHPDADQCSLASLDSPWCVAYLLVCDAQGVVICSGHGRERLESLRAETV